MSRTMWRRALVGVVVLTAAAFGIGCGPGTWWHLLKGDEEMKPEYPLTPPEGKREVTIAVSVTPLQGVPAGTELELANKIGSQLKALAELNKDTKIVVVDQSRVNAFKTNNPDRWNTGNAGEFATKLHADYWIDVTIRSLKFTDPSFGGEICRGSATLELAVYEAGKGEPKYTYPFTHQAQLKPSDTAQIGLYSNQYLGQIANEIAFKHVKYKAEQRRAAEKW